MMNIKIVTVIGAGLAGVEASYQLVKRGIPVRLYEMKKVKKSPAHQLDSFAELVCSNSFRSNDLMNAAGLLKEELRHLDSIIMRAAEYAKVPAGSALAVDRHVFSNYLTDFIRNHPLIEVIDDEIKELPNEPCIIATGPLTSPDLFNYIKDITGEDTLYFYDAAAPIIEFDSIDMSKAYFKSRYDKGEATYINCPMTKMEYDAWYKEVINANCVVPKEFELKIFEGCMPFEEMAKRGEQTLLYGPMKPVGLQKEEGHRPYAVVQLRQDNVAASLYNIVGFQTHLTFGEQQRIIRMIPGLEKANIVRYGVMHMNSFINAPKIINRYYQMKHFPDYFIAGQLSGVEGYLESAGSGFLAGINMARYIQNKPFLDMPRDTALGAQAFYLENALPELFQPMNINFGLFPEISGRHTRKDRKQMIVKHSLETINQMMEEHQFD
jgi:methylenetetrahydrofolate--tRNA-(uracil-5-)-methyltransferase